MQGSAHNFPYNFGKLKKCLPNWRFLQNRQKQASALLQRGRTPVNHSLTEQNQHAPSPSITSCFSTCTTLCPRKKRFMRSNSSTPPNTGTVNISYCIMSFTLIFQPSFFAPPQDHSACLSASLRALPWHTPSSCGSPPCLVQRERTSVENSRKQHNPEPYIVAAVVRGDAGPIRHPAEPRIGVPTAAAIHAAEAVYGTYRVRLG